MAYDIKLRYRLGKKEVVKKLSKDSDSIKTKKLDSPRISLYIADSEDNIEIPNEERWKKLMKREGAVLKWNE